MAVAGTSPAHEEEIGGIRRRLLLRNGEIARFEVQYAPFGFFELFDQLFGRGPAPQVRHVRDILALALIGGGMSDLAADDLIASLPPSENPSLRLVAQRVVGAALLPLVAGGKPKKRGAGSRGPKANQPAATTPVPE